MLNIYKLVISCGYSSNLYFTVGILITYATYSEQFI